jgi:hypothetical protein
MASFASSTWRACGLVTTHVVVAGCRELSLGSEEDGEDGTTEGTGR